MIKELIDRFLMLIICSTLRHRLAIKKMLNVFIILWKKSWNLVFSNLKSMN